MFAQCVLLCEQIMQDASRGPEASALTNIVKAGANCIRATGLGAQLTTAHACADDQHHVQQHS